MSRRTQEAEHARSDVHSLHIGSMRLAHLLYPAKSGKWTPFWFVVFPAVKPLKLIDTMLRSKASKNAGTVPLQSANCFVHTAISASIRTCEKG